MSVAEFNSSTVIQIMTGISLLVVAGVYIIRGGYFMLSRAPQENSVPPAKVPISNRLKYLRYSLGVFGLAGLIWHHTFETVYDGIVTIILLFYVLLGGTMFLYRHRIETLRAPSQMNPTTGRGFIFIGVFVGTLGYKILSESLA